MSVPLDQMSDYAVAWWRTLVLKPIRKADGMYATGSRRKRTKPRTVPVIADLLPPAGGRHERLA